METLNEFLLIFTLSVFFFSVFCFTESINLNKDIEVQEIETNTSEINTSICYNQSFKETINCLNEFVKSIYNYTVREDTDKTIEDIKLNGEDCYGYAKLYEKMAIERGYNSTTIDIYSKRLNNSLGHTFAIIYNENLSYCILDQKRIIGCFN